MKKIEFENLDEVMRGLHEEVEEQSGEGYQRRKYKGRQAEESNVRELLEGMLASSDEFTNLLVIRFNSESDERGNCKGIRGDSCVLIKGDHAAMHALQLVKDMLEQLETDFLEDVVKPRLLKALGIKKEDLPDT